MLSSITGNTHTHDFKKNIYLQMEGLKTSDFFPSGENKIGVSI